MTDVFTPKGLRLLLTTFAISFIVGVGVGVVGFVLVVDAMGR